VLNVVPQIS